MKHSLLYIYSNFDVPEYILVYYYYIILLSERVIKNREILRTMHTVRLPKYYFDYSNVFYL